MDTYKYWPVIQEKVCRRCIDGDGKGNCRLDPALLCELKEFFPRVIEVIDKVSSDQIQDYVWQLRKDVCSECAYQTPDGRCRFREKVDCALDRYFPLVVEAIEEIRRLEQIERKAV